ncbi:AFG1-family ATPase [gamma proteobacterium HTCC5015]|nr:AFG1-family ATPase [gamma proteobacterium HTCC5015]
MKPSELYLSKKAELHLEPDSGQDRLMQEYDAIQAALCYESENPLKRPVTRRAKPRRHDIRGLYIWGGVGRGKTMLMDIFSQAAQRPDIWRMHFHRFMAYVHDELRQLGHQPDTLTAVARKIAKQARVLCLDEFHVNDIGDAMILGTLLEALFQRRVTLITTSNRPPDDLYKDGLQRARFVPAIEALKAHCSVIELDNQTDYRLRTLQLENTYHSPLDSNAEAAMKQCFRAIVSNTHYQADFISINGRDIAHHGESEGAIWFEFSELCESARSQDDYLEIAAEHHSVFISNVPQMNDDNNDAARRFLNLLDVFYDCRVKVIISAEATANELYTGKRLSFEFDRATSRLLEMQSEEYLAQEHQPAAAG